MKNKKGFTLIELLAVIIILAIIALIATPAIINVIENARKKAFEDTAYGVLEGLKLNYTERVLTGTTSVPQEFTFPNSGLKLSGEQPAYGSAKIDGKGNISFALADKDKKWCAKKESTSEKVTVEDYSEENCKLDGASGGNVIFEDGDSIYFDPKFGSSCGTYTEANSATGIKEGCMKWYTFGKNNDIVNLLLDHNTTAAVAYNTNNDNKDSSQINQKVADDTEGWVGNPRLITAGEIAEITNNPNVQKFKDGTAVSDDWFYFQDNSQTNPNLSQGTATYKWLFDRISNCTKYGCDIVDNSNYGYWTSTAVSDSSSDVWGVVGGGNLSSIRASHISNNGIRPVITVPISSLK